jgi:hypothetical protein
MKHRMKLISLIIAAGLMVVLMTRQPATAAEAGGPEGGAKENSGQPSAQELARQLNNPVSNVWSLTFQYNHSLQKGFPADGTEDQDLLNFQPALPLHMTENWNLIVRPVLPFIFKHPVLTPQIDPNTDEIYADFEDESGFGDISLIALLSPARLKSRFLWGIGPTFIFPTASKDELGQEQWQAGPSAVGLWMGKDWILGVFPQQWWSFAGNSDRKSTNFTNIQYFIWRMLPGQWLIGMSPNITMNWKAEKDDNRFTVPVGLGVGKLVKLGKLPVKIQLQGQYSVIHPDDYGQRWNFQLQVIPVIPNLIPGVWFK